MSILFFIDSFGHYSAGQMSTKWNSASGSIVTSVPTGSGSGFSGTASKTIPLTPIACNGGRWLLEGARVIESFSDAIFGVSATLTILSDGRFRVSCFSYNSNASPVFSTFALSFGAIYHIQFLCSVSSFVTTPGFYSSTFNWVVYVNGVPVFSDSATTTSAGSDGHDITQFIFSSSNIDSSSGLGEWVGDFWCTDGELLGDCLIVPLFPRADGSTIQWTPLTPPNFSQVNQHIATDTTYNSTAGAGDIDEYFMDLIGPFAGTIKGAQGVWRTQNVDATSSLCQGIYRNGAGTEILAPSGSFAPSLLSPKFSLDTNRKSLFTGLDWTQPEIDGGQLGLERIS